MPIAFSCSGCAKRYEVSDALAGKKGRCKQCGTEFQIPVPRGLAPPSPGVGAVPPAPPRSAAGDAAGAAGPPPPRPAPALDLFGEDELIDDVPLAAPSGPRTSRYRDAGVAGDDADDAPAPAPAAVEKPRKKETRRAASGGLDATNPFVTIVGGGGLILVLFLAFVVWPSMKGGGGGAGAAVADANPVAANVPPAGGPAPPPFGDPAPPPGFGPPPVTVAPNGFPALPPLPPNLVPDDPNRPVGDLSRHEAALRDVVGLLGQVTGILAGVNDADSARRAGEQIQGLEQRFRLSQQEMMNLPRLQPHEERALARRMVNEISRAVDRLRSEARRIATLPGLAAAGLQMQNGANMMTAGLQPMIQAADAGPQPYVEVFIADVPDGDTSAYLKSKLEALADRQPAGMQGQWTSPPGSSSFRVWPVADVQGFASRIDFGRAQVSGRQVTVRAERVDAAEVAAFKARREEEESDRAAEHAAAASRPEDPQPPAGADEVTKALVLLQSSNAFRQREGLTRLARVRPVDDRREEVVKAIEPFATGTDHFGAIEAIKALANWKGEEAVQILIHVIERSDDVFVRREAEQQLGRLREATAAEAIAARLSDDWPAAGEALRAIGEGAEPALIERLRSPESSLRGQALEILQDIGGKPTLDAMKKLPPDPDLGVRRRAQQAQQAIANRLRAQGVQDGSAPPGRSRPL